MTSLTHSIEQEITFVVFQTKERDMTVTLRHRHDSEPVIEISLGSELRTFRLSEFTHFWLSMIEIGWQADRAYLESLEQPLSLIGKDKN